MTPNLKDNAPLTFRLPSPFQPFNRKTKTELKFSFTRFQTNSNFRMGGAGAGERADLTTLKGRKFTVFLLSTVFFATVFLHEQLQFQQEEEGQILHHFKRENENCFLVHILAVNYGEESFGCK